MQAGAGRFILTLCSLAAPVSIRPPQSPQLKPFTFFMSRVCHPDGSERLYLNMGYFDTLAHAERWAESVRRHYPNAFATVAPDASLQSAVSKRSAQPSEIPSSHPAPVQRESLSDTQVMKILENRRALPIEDFAEGNCDQIALLRPDDTGVRQALKEAVVQGTPVSFAVQLQWSAQPIDLSRVRSLTIFKAYTLYATQSRRIDRASYFLRLGFFADPISAKQVAVEVRWTFPAAAVVPVVEPEITRAREAGSHTSAIPYLGEPQVDRVLESGDTSQSRPSSDAPSPVRAKPDATVQRHESFGERELWTESDPLSESGVRHVRVEVQEHLSGRWRTIRLGDAPPDMEQPYT